MMTVNRLTVQRSARLATFLGLSASLLLGFGQVRAAGNGQAHARPNLAFHNRPGYGIHNGTLNQSQTGNDDTGTFDGTPTLSALCQSFLGKPNPYSVTAPNVDMINGDARVPVGSQTGCGTPQNETTIAVNPANPNNLVAGTNDYRLLNTRENRVDGSGVAYATLDGGKTWKNVILPGLTFQTGGSGPFSDMDSAGDPSIAFGANNTVYYANIVFSRLNNGSGVAVSVSHDGGLNWAKPVLVHSDGVNPDGSPANTNYFNDKEWIGADPNSAKVYLTWTHFTYDTNGNYLESPIVISTSSNFGQAGTWTQPSFVSPALETGPTGGIVPYAQGSAPLVGRNGEVYVAYETAVCATLACTLPTDHDAIVVAKSTDSGQTFTNTEVSTDYDFPYNPDIGRSTLTGENFRINSYPSFAIDQQTGRLWIAWADDRNGLYDANGNSIKTNGDVFVVTSSNGTQWTQPYQIGSSADEVYPAIAAYNGRVAVSYYTRAYDPNGIGLDYAYSSATGLGNLQHPAYARVTTQTENPQVQFIGIGLVTGKVLQGAFIGDYTQAALGSDLVLHPAWTDFRGNPSLSPGLPGYPPNQDAYTQAIQLP